MLLGANNSLENNVVLSLSKKGQLTANQIHEQVQNETTSIQAVYKTLRKLQREGVVVKVGKYYSIRIPWLLDLSKLTTQLQHTYSEKQYAHTLLPKKEKDKQTWKFNNLYTMNDFWSHLVLAVSEASESKIVYEYLPHSWFHLTQPEQEYQCIKTLFNNLESQYTIVGGNAHLDKWIAAQYFDFNNFEYHLANSDKLWPEKNRSMYIEVTDNFILTVCLNKNITSNIDNFYKQPHSNGDAWSEDLIKITSQNTPIRITIEKNKAKADTFKKKFQRGFGLKNV